MCLGKICCQHCGEEFDDVKNLTAHEATCKTQCQYCYYQFTDMRSLQNHTPFCIRFRVLNGKSRYKSDIFLQADEATLALPHHKTNSSTPAESALIAFNCSCIVFDSSRIAKSSSHGRQPIILLDVSYSRNVSRFWAEDFCTTSLCHTAESDKVPNCSAVVS